MAEVIKIVLTGGPWVSRFRRSVFSYPYPIVFCRQAENAGPVYD